jgi:hypothetical protein
MTAPTLASDIREDIGELGRLRERDHMVRVNMPGAPARLAAVAGSLERLLTYALPLSLRVDGLHR